MELMAIWILFLFSEKMVPKIIKIQFIQLHMVVGG